MKRSIYYLQVSLLITCFAGAITWAAYGQGAETDGSEKTAVPISTTADHTQFKALQQDFKSGPAVTRACLSCHNKAGKQIQDNIHWTWSYHNKKTGQLLGKEHLINNFCSNARGNEGMCAQCHISYGAKNFKLPKKQSQIDCLVCHDTTGSYYRLPPTKGSPACSILFAGKKPIQWKRVAQHVGLPSRANCGSCHFYGGGGDNVKHGDLSSIMADPPKSVDVHMSPDGQNFACTACHVTKNHQWSGSRYQLLARDTKGTGKPGFRRQATSCESCHGLQPHPKDSIKHLVLNTHVKRVACQSCHIPAFARGGVATRTFWDWRTAGRTRNGKGFMEENYTQGNGKKRETYWSIKGNFKNGENVVPYYAWFNGETVYTTVHTHFDPTRPVEINHLKGSADDPASRIWPFKRMVTWLQYDKGYNNLVYTHLWGNDDESFWGNFKLKKAIARGMKDAHLPFSGQVGFIKTYSYWPTTHMVAPKEKAVACMSCHTTGGRLNGIKGIYMAGHSRFTWLDRTAWITIAMTAAGILMHVLLRMFTAWRRRVS